MTKKNLPEDSPSDNLLDVLLDVLADKLAARLGATRPRFYSASSLPADCPSGRALRDRCRRLGIPTVKAGREVLVDANAYDTAVSSRARPLAAEVTDSDARALAALGLTTGGRR